MQWERFTKYYTLNKEQKITSKDISQDIKLWAQMGLPKSPQNQTKYEVRAKKVCVSKLAHKSEPVPPVMKRRWTKIPGNN